MPRATAELRPDVKGEQEVKGLSLQKGAARWAHLSRALTLVQRTGGEGGRRRERDPGSSAGHVAGPGACSGGGSGPAGKGRPFSAKELGPGTSKGRVHDAGVRAMATRATHSSGVSPHHGREVTDSTGTPARPRTALPPDLLYAPYPHCLPQVRPLYPSPRPLSWTFPGLQSPFPST